MCEDDQTTSNAAACVDRSFEANGILRKGLGLFRGESCADVVGSAYGHGGIAAAELCQMTLSDLASNLAAGFTVGGRSMSYTPPSGYTYIADLCAATCGSHGVGAAACGGSGITPVSGSVVSTTTTAELRTRIANAPLSGCPHFWGPMGPTTYTEDEWTIRCGNPTVIFLDQGTFLLGGTQVRGRALQPGPSPQTWSTALIPPFPAQIDLHTNTNYKIVGHPGGSTLDAQGLSRVLDLDYKATLMLKDVTLINGRADDGGAMRVRSRMKPGTEDAGWMAMITAQAARLEMRGGAIRNCEATNDGGAIATITATTMFGGAVG